MSNCIPNEFHGDEDLIEVEWYELQSAIREEQENNWREEDD